MITMFNFKNIFKNKKGVEVAGTETIVKWVIAIAAGFLFFYAVIKMTGKFV